MRSSQIIDTLKLPTAFSDSLQRARQGRFYILYDAEENGIRIVVLAEPPDPSHLRFEALASFSTLEASARERRTLVAWNIMSKYPTYVLLRQNASAADLNDNFASIIESHYPEGRMIADHVRFRTQHLTAINPGPAYTSEVDFQMVPSLVIYFLTALGTLLLLVACFNYVGLSIARSLDRTTEISIRKSIGARRSQVAGQFLVEAVLFCLLALVVTYGLLTYMILVFNNLQFVGEFNWEITASIFYPRLILISIVFAAVVGVLAGMYPALRLSSFQPVRIIRGLSGRTIPGPSKLTLRRVLMVVQFSLAVIFVISGVQLFRQYDYMANHNFSMDVEDILNVRLQGESYETLRSELLRHPSIDRVSASAGLPPTGWTRTTRLKSPHRRDTLDGMMNAVDPHFIDNMGLQLAAGENFLTPPETGSSQSVVINDKTAQMLGFSNAADAVGQISRNAPSNG